jgi:hypothetical protein
MSPDFMDSCRFCCFWALSGKNIKNIDYFQKNALATH